MSRTSRTTLRRSRTALIAAGALVAAAAGSAAAAAPFGASAAAAAGCTVDYKIQNQWNGGLTASVSVTNKGDALSSWQLEWSFGGGEQVSQGWNAAVTQSGSAVTAKNVSYNGSLATGASASFGFNATGNGNSTVPATFKLNGVTCNGDTTDRPTRRTRRTRPPAAVSTTRTRAPRSTSTRSGRPRPPRSRAAAASRSSRRESGWTAPPPSQASPAAWDCATTWTRP